MEELKQLVHKRGQIKARLTRFRNYFASFAEQQDIRQLKLRLSKFEGSWQEFEEVQSSIELQGTSQESDVEREEFEENYFNLMTEVEAFICTRTVNETNHSPIFGGASARIKLPTLNIPTFSGAYDQWLNFHDSFVSLIHSSPGLSDIQKFHYLKSSVKGEAAQVIESLEIAGGNYETAWTLLRDRYQNERWIIQCHVKALFDLPGCNKESHSALRRLLDSTLKHLRALKALKQPVEFWDTLVIHLIASKFDSITKREWEICAATNNNPTMDDVSKFLTHRCQVLEALHQDTTGIKTQSVMGAQSNKRQHKYGQSSMAHIGVQEVTCPVCGQTHPVFLCKDFLKLTNAQRFNTAKELKLCFNCLKTDHQGQKCEAGSCRKCSKRHNTLLHLTPHDASSSPNANTLATSTATLSRPNTTVSNHSSMASKAKPYVILSTVIVKVLDKKGGYHLCRALLDSGSQSNFLTESMCAQLGLHPKGETTPVTGIGQSIVKIAKSVDIDLKSRFNGFRATIPCLVLPKITGHLPAANLDISSIKIPNNIKLADPSFGTSAEIQLLIGAGLFYELLCVGQIRTSNVAPIIQKTQLGWVVSGGLGLKDRAAMASTCNLGLEEQLLRFWTLEETPDVSKWSREEQFCEDHFCKTFHRDNQGRCVVGLPVNEQAGQLGQSREMALKRFYSLEARFNRQPGLREQYVNFMKEYDQLGHMEKITDETETSSPITYYLPHHAIFKSSSTTTKLRVVFDGSAETTSGLSLNSILMVGPTIQQDLFSLLTRFRTHTIVLTADIAKMYRQVMVDSTQTDLQRIFWREDLDQPIATFRLKTITYGTASAPFLATRCLQQVAFEGRDQFPLASIVTTRDFYVDDLLTGADTVQEARIIRDQLILLLASGGFELCKWSSNEPALLEDFPTEAVDITAVQVADNDQPKTLGLTWNSTVDALQYSVQPPTSTRVTKRSILSTIAHIFDPLGLVGPVILRAKMLMQQLWQLRLDWDESVPIGMHTAWKQFEHQLTELNTLCIPRRVIGGHNLVHLQLHGFCDASEKAYGACLYIRGVNSQGIGITNLLCSKSRVAPLKNISLPRLELCGALLLAKLAHKTTETLGIEFENHYFWTDSTIVLAWLASPSNTWKTFIANRVSEIQTLTRDQNWNHITTRDNPADYISRGLSPLQISQLDSWWKGPPWLSESSQNWPIGVGNIHGNVEPPERRNTVATHLNVSDNFDLFSRYSTLRKLQHTTAYCLRFRNNTARTLDKREFGPLSAQELNSALECLVKMVQGQEFTQEIHALQHKKSLPPNSKLVALHPFLDDKEVLRVGGRLQNAPISYDQKHPILLPSRNQFTRLLMINEHLRQLHAGPQSLVASIRTRFWPLSARGLARHVVRSCIRCFRVKPSGLDQLMGDLPTNRVSPCRPFLNCGVDYCGPFYLKPVRRRGGTTVKTYLAIFICFATKAVHLELVTDLTSEAFLGALRRFISRRGRCANIYSDNATTFVGAKGQLSDLSRLFQTEVHQSRVINALAQDDISWHFIPPRSPHFGGLWESAVKSAKFHLKRIAGSASLTFEEMSTLITQVEACLNSRPITPLTDSPDDLNCLTPGHFLIGDALTATSEPELLSIPTNRLTLWQRVQQLRQHFWARWSVEYLSQLQQRNKWRVEKQSDLLPGALVLLKEDNVPPLKWHLGRITSLHPGADGMTRVVSLKTSNGIVKRALSKICLLPLEKNPLERPP